MIPSEKILLSPPAPALAAPAGPVPDDGLFWESRIAAEVGISRERLRSLRDAHMTEDTHFIRKKNAVVLTISGLDKLHALLAPAAPTAAAGAQPLIVRVKTNENFMAGMTLEVISAGENCYQYLGRLPRRHGRW